MKTRYHNLYIFCAFLSLVFLTQLMVGCGSDDRPNHTPTVIEESQGGLELIDREFGECDESATSVDPENREFNYSHKRQPLVLLNAQKQAEVLEKTFPHNFKSLGQMFPYRGSWRKTKAEIMDIVDREIWSPEDNDTVPMLKFFDMVLLINVADRDKTYPENSSAQRMQVVVRNGDGTHDIKNWKVAVTWPISSGRPCGQKIATPTGVFKFDPYEHPTDPRLSRFSPDYYSRQFDDIQMYETMFLHHYYQANSEFPNGKLNGVAIHGTYKTEALGRRDSGGCIRLNRKNSKCLYETFTGKLTEQCVPDSELDYWGQVPSLLKFGGEADPEYLSGGGLQMAGYKVLVAIYNDKEDLL